MASYTRRLIQGSSVIFILSLLGSVVGYFIRLVLARHLTPAEYGLFYAVFAFLSVFVAFRSLGVNAALTKFLAEFRVKQQWQNVKNSAAYYLAIETGVYAVMVVALLALSNFLATAYFGHENAASVLQILLLAFGFSLFESLFGGFFQGLYKMTHYAFLHFLRNLFVLIAAWLMLEFGFGVTAPAYAYAIAYAVTAFLGWLWYRQTFPEGKRLRTTWDKPLFKRMLGYGTSVAAGSGAASGLSNVDTLVLTSFRSLTEVGWYNTAMPTAGLVRTLFRSVATVLFPLSSELHAEKNAHFAEGITRLYRYLLALVVPISVGLAMLAPTALSLFFGENYDPAAPALAILAIGAVFSTLFMIASNILMGIGAVVPNSAILIGGSLFIVLGDLAFVPGFGIVGAAAVNTTAQFLMMAAALFYVRKNANAQLPWSAWLRTILCALLIPLAIVGVRSLSLEPMAQLAASIIAGGAAYILGVFLLRIISVRELLKIASAGLGRKII